MSVNFGGNPSLVPTQAPVPDGQPPQQSPTEPSPPTLSVRAASGSPLATPATTGELTSTDPALSTPGSAANAETLPEPTAGAFLAALSCRDWGAVNQQLDQGLDLGMVAAGKTLLEHAITDLFDQPTLNRVLSLVGPVQRNRQAADLWDACETGGNAVAMECLLNWRVPQPENLVAEINDVVSDAITKGDAVQWAASFRLLRRYCPDQKPVVARFLMALTRSLDLGCLKVLTSELKPGLPRNRRLIEHLLQAAMQGQRVDFGAELIEWVKLKGQLPRGAAFPFNDYVLRLDDSEVVFLLKANYPFHSRNLPLPYNVGRAAEIQALLFGETLAHSAVGRRMNSGGSRGKNLVPLILKCFSPTYEINAWKLGREKTERRLFFAGFRKPLISALVEAMTPFEPSLGLQRPNTVFVLCSLLNELQANEDLKTSDDPLLRAQLEAITDAATETLQAMIGGAESFFAAILVCVSPDSGVDKEKLRLIFEDRKGFPQNVVNQLEVALSAAFDMTMDRKAVWQFDPDATYRQVQSMMKKHILLNTMKSLWTTLPAAMQSHALITGRRSDHERIAMHVAVSVISQYCEQMKADIDTSALQVWQEFAGLAADAFGSSPDLLSSSDSDSDADGESSDDDKAS